MDSNDAFQIGSVSGLRLSGVTFMSRHTGLAITEQEHLRQSINDILTTPLGARVMLPEYGSEIHTLVDKPLSRPIISRIIASVAGAISKWEPRVQLTRVLVNLDGLNLGRLSVTLEGYYLLQEGPMRLPGISLDFIYDNPFFITDEELRRRIAAGTATFGGIADGVDQGLTIAFVADFGTAGSNQTLCAATVETWQPDLIVLGGDNNYPGGVNPQQTMAANTAVFSSYINAGKVFPVLGNHDYEGNAMIASATFARFPYLPGNKRYYTLYFAETDTRLFFVNTGYSSVGGIFEPDGVDANSAQAAWLRAEVAASTARYNFIFGHHPWVHWKEGGVSGYAFPALSWIRDLPKVQLYAHGHTHIGSHAIYANKLHILDVSATADERRQVSSFGAYGTSDNTVGLWQYAGAGTSGPPIVGKIQITQERAEVSVCHGVTGQVLHNFAIYPWV